MRTVILIAAALFLTQYGIAQGGRGGRGGGRGPGAEPPPPPPNPGFECFQNVEVPEFPESALRAHIDATVWITLQVTPQGTADKIDTKVTSAWADGPKIFTPAVEKVLRAAKFKPECAGKTVAVVYRYDLEGNPIAAPKVTEKQDARIMYIESSPELVAAGKKTGPAAR